MATRYNRKLKKKKNFSLLTIEHLMLVFKVKSYGKYPKHDNWWKLSWYSSDILMDKLVLPFSCNQGTFETVKSWKNHCSGTIYRAIPFFLKISKKKKKTAFLKKCIWKLDFNLIIPQLPLETCVAQSPIKNLDRKIEKIVTGSKQLWNFNQQYNVFFEATLLCIYIEKLS